MTSRESVSAPSDSAAFSRWWRRFWLGALVLVGVTVGAVYVLTPTEGNDPGDAAAIPLTIGAALCALLIVVWGAVCLAGLIRGRRAGRT